jgi:SAM-dependent methyltransferase
MTSGIVAEVFQTREILEMQYSPGMIYTEDQVRKVLNEIIITIYYKNPIRLLDLWTGEGEKKYITFLYPQYEHILLDFNRIFPDRSSQKRVIELSSFLGVVDVALAKIGFDVYTYDIPEFQKNENLNRIYSKFNIHPSSGYLKDIWKTGLPYPDNFFDAIILSEVLEHLNFNPLPVFQEINRIMKPDGILYITTPNQVNFINRIKIVLGRSIRNSIHDSLIQLDQSKNTICGIHWREYTLLELVQLLEKTGFVISANYYSSTTQIDFPLWAKKIFYRILNIFFPTLEDSITVIAKKNEYKPIKFWFNHEYIKYIKMDPQE